MGKAALVFLVGPSGSGKTAIGRRLARRLKWKFCDTDSQVEREEKCLIHNIFADRGEEYFRDIERRVVEKILERKDVVVATGGGLPVFNGMMDVISTAGITIYLDASLDSLWNRLTIDRAELEKRPLLRKVGRSGLEKMILARATTYSRSHVRYTTDNKSLTEIAKEIAEILRPLIASSS